MNPAAVLSVIVKANGVAAANKQIMTTDKTLRATNASGERAAASMAGVGKSSRKAAGGLFAAAKAAGGLVAAYAGIKGIEKSIHTTEDLGKTTLTLARSFGLATDQASRWAAVSKARGTEGKQLTMGFKTLSTQIRNAQGGAKAGVDAFKDLGISQRDLAAHGDDLNYMLNRVSDGLKEMPAGTARAALQAKLFGRTWLTISPLIRDGSQALQDQLNTADEYGATLSGKTVGQIQETIKAQREAKLASMGLQVTLGTTLIPVLDKLIETFALTVKNFREGVGTAGRVRDAFARIGQVLAPLGTSIGQIVGWLQKHENIAQVLIGTLGGLAVAVWAVNTALAANPFVLAVVGIAAFTIAIVTAYRESKTFRDVVNATWSWLSGAAQTVAHAVVAALGFIASTWRSTTTAITGEVGAWHVLFGVINQMFQLMLATARLALAGLQVIFRAGMLALGPIVVAAFTLLKGLFTGAFQALKGIVSGGLQVIRGVILVFGGLFKGDFGQVWNGIKTIFRGGITALKGILQGAWSVLKAPVQAIGEGIHNAFSNSWGRIKDLFRSSINAVIGFLNVLIHAVNLIPGVPNIGAITPIGGGGGGTGGGSRTNIPPNKLARGGAFGRTGGYVDNPITLMGEEAPRHPEYVIPTNPAYRGRARGLLGQAAQALGFAAGGVSQYNHVYPRHIGPDPRFTTFTPQIVSEIASSVGLPGTTFAQIARGESGYQPGVQQRDPGDGMVGYGLWQNTPNAWGQGAARQYFDRLGGIPQMFNPVTNALMARYLYQAAGNSISPWHGTRFVTGGRAGGGLGPLPSADSLIGSLPHVSDAMGIFKGLGKYVLDKAGAFIKSHVIEPVTSVFTGRPGRAQPGMPGYGVSGVGTFMGVPMAKWVIESLQYAQSKGVTVRPTSGYRPGFDPHTASGRSEHQGTQYPHGAVDFGGYNSGGAMKMAVVNATRDFKWPLLAPIGFHDEGHASGTGHARGGVFSYLGSFARGGITGAEGMAYLHKNEAILPMAKGGKVKHKPSPPLKPGTGVMRHGRGSLKIPILPHRGGVGIVDPRVFGKAPAPRRFTDPIVDSGGGGGTDDAQNQGLIDAMDRQTAAIEEQTRINNLITEQQTVIATNQQRILAMAQQGDKLVAAVVAAVNGGIGGSAGLGFQSPSYAGGMARYK